jgi:hypothetical protein
VAFARYLMVTASQSRRQSKKIPAEQLCDEMTADDDYFGNLHKIVMR